MGRKKIIIDNYSPLCYDCGNSEKAMKRNSTYSRNFREKMVGANLHSKVWKQSRSFGPNGDFLLSRLQRIPTLQGLGMIVP